MNGSCMCVIEFAAIGMPEFELRRIPLGFFGNHRSRSSSGQEPVQGRGRNVLGRIPQHQWSCVSSDSVVAPEFVRP